MNTLRKSLTLTAVALVLSQAAHAKNNDEERKLHNQAAEYRTGSNTSIVTQEMIDDALKNTTKRDTHRENEEMSELKRSELDAELKRVESERALMVGEFILENVPASILASGEKAVNAYIQTNFVDKNGTPSSGNSVEVIWGSTDNALSIPDYESNWKPVVKSVSVDAENLVTPEPDSKGKSDGANLSDDEKLAIQELGLTEADLLLMMGGEAATKKNANENKNPESASTPVQTNVVIGEINVDRVVIMGNLSHADVKITLQVIRGDQSRNVTKAFNNIKPGFLFEVDGARFEFVSLNKSQVVFENLETQKTFRSLLN